MHLTDSSDLPFKKFGILGKSWQETRSGKNMINVLKDTLTTNGITFTNNGDGSITINGTATAVAYFSMNEQVFTIENGKTYGLYLGGTTNGLNMVVRRTDVNTQLFILSNAQESVTNTYNGETVDDAYAYLRVESGTTLNNVTAYPMLVEGSEIGEWEQCGASPSTDYQSRIKNAGEDGSVDFVVQNKSKIKNMLSTTTKNGITCNVDENKRTYFSGTSTATAIFIFQNYNDSRLFKPGTYTLSIANKPPSSNSFIRLEFSKDKSTAYSFADIYGASANKFVTFTLKEEGYLKVSLAIESGVTINNLDLTPQLEIGEIASDIVANEEQSISFPMQDGQVLRKGDYLADDGIHHVRKQIVLDGTEWLDKNNEYSDAYSFFTSEYTDIIDTSNTTNIMCNMLKADTNNSANTLRIVATNGNIVFNFKKDFVEYDATKLKTKLAELYNQGTPIIIEIPIAEEEIVPYDEAQQTAYDKKKELETYRNVTNVFCTDETSCEFDTEYYKDLATILTN